MYRLLLVDDEEEVRESMLKNIEWEAMGFEIAGVAENGREALEIAESTAVDVLITDIKMPFVDGIMLSQRISEKFPDTKIIILTGFGEFEYAQKAIQFNVEEYILKPISPDELTETLKKIKKTLDKEIAQKEDMIYLRQCYNKSLPIMRQKFLSSLVTTRLTGEEISRNLRNYGIELNGDSYVVSVISIDLNSVNDNLKGQPMNDGTAEASDSGLEYELLKLAVFNIVEEIVGKNNLGIAFLHNESIVVISNFLMNQKNTLLSTRQ